MGTDGPGDKLAGPLDACETADQGGADRFDLLIGTSVIGEPDCRVS